MPINLEQYAEYVLLRLNHAGEHVSNKKLNKILYYTQAWYLAHNEDDIFDEEPEAWVHGPVYPKIYKKYKAWGSGHIDVENKKEGVLEKELKESEEHLELTENQKKLIDAALNHYAGRSAFSLEYSSHSEKPWVDARKGLDPYQNSNNIITRDSMRSYFRRRLEKAKEKTPNNV